MNSSQVEKNHACIRGRRAAANVARRTLPKKICQARICQADYEDFACISPAGREIRPWSWRRAPPSLVLGRSCKSADARHHELRERPGAKRFPDYGPRTRRQPQTAAQRPPSAPPRLCGRSRISSCLKRICQADYATFACISPAGREIRPWSWRRAPPSLVLGRSCKSADARHHELRERPGAKRLPDYGPRTRRSRRRPRSGPPLRLRASAGEPHFFVP